MFEACWSRDVDPTRRSDAGGSPQMLPSVERRSPVADGTERPFDRIAIFLDETKCPIGSAVADMVYADRMTRSHHRFTRERHHQASDFLETTDLHVRER